MPLLAQEPPQPPHLRVSATRGGGDILAVHGGSTWAGQAGRTRWPLHKASSGGWSQAQHQRSAEEAWEENARELAARVTDAAGEFGAELIVAAGDSRSRGLLLKHLNSALQAAVIMIEQEIPVDSPAMADAAVKALIEEEDRQCRERFAHWRTQLAHDSGVEGLAPTLTGLADGQVSELFMADRPSSAAAAWIGPDGTDLAASGTRLRQRGVAEPVCERADAAIVRAAAAIGAELRFLPEDLVAGEGPATIRPQDGICATLRYPRASG